MVCGGSVEESVSDRSLKVKEATIDLDRLCYAAQRSRWVLRRFREERREAVRQYTGSHWSEEGAYKSQPVNLLAQYVQIVGRSLIAKNPRVMLSTFDQGNKPAVAAMQTWANSEIVRMRMADVFQRVVLDALFSVGVCKVGLATPADSSSVAWTLPAGQPFAERVDLDDFVFDVHARDFSEVAYIGHRFRAPLEVIKGSKIYSKFRFELTASQDPFYNLEGDERISTLGRGFYAGNDEEFEDMVDLWEFYLPRHRVIVTLVDDQLTGSDTTQQYANSKDRHGGALRMQKWMGPDGGPYHILSYGVVPGNCMPKAPIQDLLDLHEAVNNIYRKLIRQAERQKKQMLFQGVEEDARRLQEGSDGEWVRVDNPQATQERAAGGPDQSLFQLGVHLAEVYNRMAGNLDLIGGLGPQSKTLGQDKMLDQSASSGVQSMQDVTVNFVADCLKSLCWYWWHDPFKVMRSKHSLPGIPDMGITRQVTPQQRMRTRFDDLEIEIDPYSMQHQTPEQRGAALDAMVTQILGPLMPVLQQQGVQFDAQTWLKKRAAFFNMPDLPEIVTMGEPPPATGLGTAPQQSGGGPAETTRNYVRRSVGQNTPANQQSDLMNSLSKNIAAKNGSHP